jgi:predicted HTH transcriptional regulator
MPSVIRRFVHAPRRSRRDAEYASLVEQIERLGALQAGPFDAAPAPAASLDDLDAAKVTDFMARAQRIRGAAFGVDGSLPNMLSDLNLLNAGRPTNASVLLFGKAPQRFLPTSEVKCAHFHDTEVRTPILSCQSCKGTVSELVGGAVDFVMSHVRSTETMRPEPSAPPVASSLPREAVAEAIVNAVAHRDYTSNASVQVMLFADRLEVWSPGELPPPLTTAALREPHSSVPRNALLAGAMFLAGYLEMVGAGTLGMTTLCREAGLEDPEFQQDNGMFRQILRLRAIRGRTGSATPEVKAATTPEVCPDVNPEVTPEVKLLRAIEGEMTRRALQDALRLKDDDHFRTAYLLPALAEGLIEMTVPDKPRSSRQKYRLTELGLKCRGSRP